MADQATLPARLYTDEDVENGLQAIAFHGSTHKASKALNIPRGTLEGWKTTHTARYHEIRNNTLTQTRARLAAEYEDLAREAVEGSRLAVRATTSQLKAGTSKNPADAASKLAQTAGIMTDKANVLRGHATHIIETRDATQLLAELATKLPNAGIVDSTATEIT